MTRQIVILGASITGLGVAHKLLKHTYPLTQDFKVTLVSPSDHVYWNLTSVRGIVPGQFKDDDLFQPFLPGFDRYAKESFEFILGTADKVDPSSNTVLVNDGREIRYDHLVVATGASYKDGMPWKPLKDHQSTLDALHDLQSKVAAANTIVIGGGDATGSEVAGEIAFEYYQKGKEVTIVTSDKRLLPTLPEHISQIAEKELSRLDVKIVHGTKITGTSQTTDGKIKLSLFTGSPDLIVDLYLPPIGETPNTSFLLSPFLNDKGDVTVDEFLRVKSTTNIWAAGDVTGLEPKQAKYAEDQAVHLAKNLHNVLQDREPVKYGTSCLRVIAVTLGRSKGTGVMCGWRLPSISVWLLKGRYLGTDKFKSIANGERMLMSAI